MLGVGERSLAVGVAADEDRAATGFAGGVQVGVVHRHARRGDVDLTALPGLAGRIEPAGNVDGATAGLDVDAGALVSEDASFPPARPARLGNRRRQSHRCTSSKSPLIRTNQRG